MQRHDLDRIEKTLGVSLPAAYREVMRAYPFPSEHQAAELWMPDDAATVLELNDPVSERRVIGQPWPRHLVLIGSDGGEEDFVLDTRAASGPVFAYERESGDLRPLAPDFSAWLALLREWQREIDDDTSAMQAAHARKRWWQFWIPRPPA